MSRILALPSAPHPFAEIVSVADGVIIYRWLRADGVPADSGGSVQRYEVTPDASEPTDAEITALLAAG